MLGNANFELCCCTLGSAKASQQKRTAPKHIAGHMHQLKRQPSVIEVDCLTADTTHTQTGGHYRSP